MKTTKKIEQKHEDPKNGSAFESNIVRNTSPKKRKPAYLYVKRSCDIVVSLTALLVLFIPLLLIGIAIRLETPGPAIFTQLRMGKNGKPFTIYKFRTMKLSAPNNVMAQAFPTPERYVTKLGALLRRTSIDELPQLLNVLKGDMSLVGYRPICLAETEFNDLRMSYGVFQRRPGITGLAQVKGRDKLHYTEKAELDAQYVANCSLKMDLWILMQTVKIVFTGEGVI